MLLSKQDVFYSFYFLILPYSLGNNTTDLWSNWGFCLGKHLDGCVASERGRTRTAAQCGEGTRAKTAALLSLGDGTSSVHAQPR